jgi:hypothetical protein
MCQLVAQHESSTLFSSDRNSHTLELPGWGMLLNEHDFRHPQASMESQAAARDADGVIPAYTHQPLIQGCLGMPPQGSYLYPHICFQLHRVSLSPTAWVL